MLFAAQSWISSTEQSSIKSKMREWVNHMQRNSALVSYICNQWESFSVFRPLRCVWICRGGREDGSSGVGYRHIISCPSCCEEILPDYEGSIKCPYLNATGTCTCSLKQYLDDLPVLFGGPKELGFIPVICLSASIEWKEDWQRESMSWTYIQGAGDDEEAWVPMVQPLVSEKLTPQLLWDNTKRLLEGPDKTLVRYVYSSRHLIYSS